MRRLAAMSLLLLLLQSLGAGVALGQLSLGDTGVHCTEAAAPDAEVHPSGHPNAQPNAHPNGHPNAHPSDADDGAPGTHCSMPWMTGCGSPTACGAQAMRTDAPAGTVRSLRATDGCPRSSRIPNSPSAELEAPPPRD